MPVTKNFNLITYKDTPTYYAYAEFFGLESFKESPTILEFYYQLLHRPIAFKKQLKTVKEKQPENVEDFVCSEGMREREREHGPCQPQFIFLTIR